MKVRAQFFAQLRDLIGASTLDVELADGATTGDLLASIYRKFPSLGANDKAILLGAGLEFVDRSYKLHEGEEIAIMPPVQGG